MKLTVTVNGRQRSFEIRGPESLLDALRNEGFFGVKRGCENGDCGSCAVLVDGKAVCSCLMMAGQAEGREITTIEGLGDPVDPHPLQSQFVQMGATQCGFCIPGMILSAKSLLDKVPDPDHAQMAEALDGVLCRCTGYVKQFEAVRAAARIMREAPAARRPGSGSRTRAARPSAAPRKPARKGPGRSR